jgi:hypothetical protein
MAMIFCRECKAEISNGAKICPRCGIAKPGRTAFSTLLGCVGVIVILAIIGSVGSSLKTGAAPASTPSETTEGSAMVDATKQAPPMPSGVVSTDSIPEASSSNWTYGKSADEMRGTHTHSASLVSDNELAFDFPYNGGSSGTLSLRSGDRSGLNVILRMEKGQFLCNEYGHPTVSVKFDNGPVRKFGCSESNDNAAGVLFIDSESRFLAALKHSKKMTIEADFFQEGSRQLKFTTSGLVWH